MSNPLLPFRLVPEYRDYVWGGRRLRPDHPITAEAWVVYEGNIIAEGPFAGKTLAQAADEAGLALLGSHPTQRTASRFPLLIKLLDCAGWLSLQVHPNDEQAARLEGPGEFGKTEAWHILQADPEAELLCGLAPGTQANILNQSIRNGTLVDHMQRLKVDSGDTIFIRAGTIHALGPGLLLYEVQQTSNLTYRVYDWGRPASPNRPLHIEKSLAVADPAASGSALPLPTLSDGAALEIASCQYFTLQTIAAEQQTVQCKTAGQSFHALTVIEGSLTVATADVSYDLACYETLLVPASCPAYRLIPRGAYRALLAQT
jgi:mannose-6-phosphate isomerase